MKKDCLHPDCKNEPKIQIKITEGRLVTEFNLCFDHSKDFQTMIDARRNTK